MSQPSIGAYGSDESDDLEEVADDLEEEWQMECPYCDGEGWIGDGTIKIECGECLGTGWF